MIWVEWSTSLSLKAKRRELISLQTWSSKKKQLYLAWLVGRIYLFITPALILTLECISFSQASKSFKATPKNMNAAECGWKKPRGWQMPRAVASGWKIFSHASAHQPLAAVGQKCLTSCWAEIDNFAPPSHPIVAQYGSTGTGTGTSTATFWGRYGVCETRLETLPMHMPT